ncbi:MAG TPA: RNA polymerase sigma-54 factor, partial [Draconibacterium sp.]|nr:RNA polymerase sigma-54 factor [Draconibacterium sp.]
MEQKLSLQQKLLQKLSPQQIQVIKLLEIPTMQLEQRIKKELEENPVLELESDNPSSVDDQMDNRDDNNSDIDNEEFSMDDYYEDEEIPTYKLNVNNYSKDDKYIDVPFSVGTSFHEFLNEQLGLADLDDEEQQLAEYIIGNIDDDGYLRRDLMAISDDLAFNMNLDVPEEKLEKILLVIQEFDPPGIAARDLRECLLLQLNRKDENGFNLARTIVKDY